MKTEVSVRANRNRSGEITDVFIRLVAFNDAKTRVLGKWALTKKGVWTPIITGQAVLPECHIEDVKAIEPWSQTDTMFVMGLTSDKTVQAEAAKRAEGSTKAAQEAVAKAEEVKKAEEAKQAELKELHEMALQIWKVRGHSKYEFLFLRSDNGQDTKNLEEKTKCIKAAKMLIKFFDEWEKKAGPPEPEIILPIDYFAEKKRKQ